jgi:hypothetical protein
LSQMQMTGLGAAILAAGLTMALFCLRRRPAIPLSP